MPRLPFHPSPDQLVALTDDLVSPDLSLREIAARHNTTLDALNLYLVSAPALEHIATLELTAAVRTRAAAVSHLHRAVATLTELLDDYSKVAQLSMVAPLSRAVDRPTVPANTGAPPASVPEPPAGRDPRTPALPSTLLLAERQRDRARRAAYLLFRLATFTPRPLAGLGAPSRATDSPASAGYSVPTTRGHASPTHRPSHEPATRATEPLAAVAGSVSIPKNKGTPNTTSSPASSTLSCDTSPAALLAAAFDPPRGKFPHPGHQPRTARDLIATAGGAP